MKPTQALPIYRGKCLSESFFGQYVTGDLIQGRENTWFITVEPFDEHGLSMGVLEINPSTLSVHYTNSRMNDSEGTPIFASLSSDGNGGDNLFLGNWNEGFMDICESLDKMRTVLIRDNAVNVTNLIDGSNCNFQMVETSLCKITGIHTIEGEGEG